jgi:hypothetical protein
MATPRTSRFIPRPALNTVAAKLAVALVVGSVIAGLAGQHSAWIVLIPEWIWTRFAVWQLFTFAFIQTSPYVIFGALILWSIGGQLEAQWGSKRFLRVILGISVLAGILTVVTSWLFPHLGGVAHEGGMLLGTAVWVTYGLANARTPMNFWGAGVTGTAFAWIGIGLVLLTGLFYSWVLVMPELWGIALIFGYLKLGAPQLWLLRIQSWRLHQRLKGRSKHLRVIGKDRNMPSDSDRYMH